VGEPVGLAGGVVVDVLEAERFEPTRGSWAQVSDIVVAVDDDRTPSVERARAVSVELFEGDVDRTRKMDIGIFGRWQHLHELGSLFDQGPEFWQLDPPSHVWAS
jgi:hypothetical protein